MYLDGRSAGGWHSALGGGLWFRSMGYVGTLTYARGEGDHLYLRLGFAF